MASVIEIVDSDDNSMDGLHTEITGVVLDMGNKESDETEFADVNDVANTVEEATTTIDAVPTAMPDSSNDTTNESKSKRKQSRKSAHQPLRASPEIEFCTEPKSVDETVKVKKMRRAVPRPKPPENPKPSADAAKLPTEESPAKGPEELAFEELQNPVTEMTSTQQVMTAHAQFHRYERTQQILRRVAKERVRVNYLLSLYGMPQINFALKTQPTRLQFQFEDRLKHWKMRHVDAVRVMENNLAQQQMPSGSAEAAAQPNAPSAV